jgi:hypothetical protein
MSDKLPCAEHLGAPSEKVLGGARGSCKTNQRGLTLLPGNFTLPDYRAIRLHGAIWGAAGAR